jgi:hypothetical protein
VPVEVVLTRASGQAGNVRRSPHTPIPLSPEDSAPLYEEMMGAMSFDEQFKTMLVQYVVDKA